MMLGASSSAIEAPADAGAVMADAGSGAGDGGVDAGEELLRFTDAAHRLDDDLVAARAALVDAIGEAAMIDAAVIAAIFRSLNIAADASGIRVDDLWESEARRLMDELGTSRFRTAANSPALAD